MNFASPLSPEGLPARIERLLTAQIPEATQIAVGPVRQLFGGNARKAYSFDVRYERGASSVSLPCVMLSVVGGRHVESHLGWEYEVLRRLGGTGVRSPAAIAVDHEGVVVGAPSIVLERIPGKTSVVEFLAAHPESESRALTRDLAEAAACLHGVDLQAAGFTAAAAEPLAIARAQVAHWKRIFEEQRLEPMPVMAWLFSWLEDHVPQPQRISLVHGDLRPGNFLYEGGRITALLDWEMAHFGDPLEDLGWIYRPMWSPKKFVSLQEFAERYALHSGRALYWQDLMYYRVFSEMKFATISLTAAARFAAGQTLNLRHADRASMINECLRRCLHWVEQWPEREIPEVLDAQA